MHMNTTLESTGACEKCQNESVHTVVRDTVLIAQIGVLHFNKRRITGFCTSSKNTMHAGILHSVCVHI